MNNNAIKDFGYIHELLGISLGTYEEDLHLFVRLDTTESVPSISCEDPATGPDPDEVFAATDFLLKHLINILYVGYEILDENNIYLNDYSGVSSLATDGYGIGINTGEGIEYMLSLTDITNKNTQGE